MNATKGIVDMTDEEVLDKSINRLKEGWTKGRSFSYTDTGMNVCATGALMLSVFNTLTLLSEDVSENSQFARIFHLLNNKATELMDLPIRGLGIIYYNDRIAQSVDDVITVFEKVRADL